jgi:hypothetical protein
LAHEGGQSLGEQLEPPGTPQGGTHWSLWQVPRFLLLGYTEKVEGSTQRADVSTGFSMQ